MTDAVRSPGRGSSATSGRNQARTRRNRSCPMSRIQALGLGDRHRRLCRRSRRTFLERLKSEGGLILVVIAAFAAASVAMGRRLSRPIVSMSVVMERLAAGNFDIAPTTDDARSRTRAHGAGAGRVQAKCARSDAAGIEAATTRALTEAERERASAERRKGRRAGRGRAASRRRPQGGRRRRFDGAARDGFTPDYAKIRDDFNAAIESSRRPWSASSTPPARSKRAQKKSQWRPTIFAPHRAAGRQPRRDDGDADRGDGGGEEVGRRDAACAPGGRGRRRGRQRRARQSCVRRSRR